MALFQYLQCNFQKFSKIYLLIIFISYLTDLVLLTGDLVDGRVSSLSRAAEPLSRVMSKYGNFFVSGKGGSRI